MLSAATDNFWGTDPPAPDEQRCAPDATGDETATYRSTGGRASGSAVSSSWYGTVGPLR